MTARAAPLRPLTVRRSPTHGLPRHRRLLRSNDFTRTERGGKRAQGSFVVVVTKPGRTRVGFTVSKKVGNAVARNWVKRRLREVLRHHPELWRGLDVVVIARPEAAGRSLAALDADVVATFARLASGATTPARKH